MIIIQEDTDRKNFILNQLETDYGQNINWRKQYDNIYFLLSDLEKQTNKGQITIPIIEFRQLRIYLSKKLNLYPNYPKDKPNPMASGLHSEEAAENHFFLHPETYGRLPNYDVYLFYKALVHKTDLYQLNESKPLSILSKFLKFLKESKLNNASWIFA